MHSTVSLCICHGSHFPELHYFWDDFSILSPTPHACLLLTHAYVDVNMQPSSPVSFVTSPIAYFPHPVYPHPCVFPITLLLLKDDTSRAPLRHTYLRHTYHVSAARNFRLNPAHPLTPLRDLRPLIPHPTYASPPICVPRHIPPYRDWRDARAQRARQTGACRLPTHFVPCSVLLCFT